jgi:hypothetical protein
VKRSKKPGVVRRCAQPGFLVFLLFAACVDRLPDQDLRILTATPSAKLSADLLWKAFQDNAADARRTYFGKVIEVTGTATVVGTDAPTDRYVLFGQTDKFGIRANLLDERAREILSSIPDSRRLTLRCFCDGLNGNVVLKSCIKP